MRTLMRFAARPLRESWLRTIAFTAIVFCLTACLPNAPATIKIGLVAPFSGRYREIGYQAVHGARLALSEFNAAGGAHGRPVSLLALDDASDADTAIEQANRMLTDSAVVAVIGHWLDGTTRAAVPIYARAGLPILATSAAPRAPENGGRTFFRLYPTTEVLATAMEDTATQYGLRAMCLCDVVTGAELLTIGHSDNLSPAVVGGPLWSLREFARLAGDNADGSYFVTPGPHPPAVTEASVFLANHRAAFPDEPVGWTSLHAYEATRVLLTALSTNSEPTATYVAEALTQTDFYGVSRHVSFDEGGEWATPQLSASMWRGGRRVRP